MDQMTGIEAVKQMREYEKITGKRTPVIGLTSLVGDNTVRHKPTPRIRKRKIFRPKIENKKKERKYNIQNRVSKTRILQTSISKTRISKQNTENRISNIEKRLKLNLKIEFVLIICLGGSSAPVAQGRHG